MDRSWEVKKRGTIEIRDKEKDTNDLLNFHGKQSTLNKINWTKKKKNCDEKVVGEKQIQPVSPSENFLVDQKKK